MCIASQTDCIARTTLLDYKGPPHVSLMSRHFVQSEEIKTVDVEFLDDGPMGERVPESLLRRVVRAVRIAIGDIPAPGD